MRTKKLIFRFTIDDEISYDGKEKNLTIIGTPVTDKDDNPNGYLWFNKGGVTIPMTQCDIVLDKSSLDFSKAFDIKFEEQMLFVKAHNKTEIVVYMPVEVDD